MNRGDSWGGGGVAVGRGGTLSSVEDDDVSRDAVHNDKGLPDDIKGEFLGVGWAFFFPSKVDILVSKKKN